MPLFLYPATGVLQPASRVELPEQREELRLPGGGGGTEAPAPGQPQAQATEMTVLKEALQAMAEQTRLMQQTMAAYQEDMKEIRAQVRGGQGGHGGGDRAGPRGGILRGRHGGEE